MKIEDLTSKLHEYHNDYDQLNQEYENVLKISWPLEPVRDLIPKYRKLRSSLLEWLSKNGTSESIAEYSAEDLASVKKIFSLAQQTIDAIEPKLKALREHILYINIKRSNVLNYFKVPEELYNAVYAGDNAKLEALLQDPLQKSFINYRLPVSKWTMLFIACLGGADELTVKILLLNGADPYMTDSEDRLPIYLAVNAADPAIVVLLIDAMQRTAIQTTGSKINLFDIKSSKTGQNLLHPLCYAGCGIGSGTKSERADLKACFDLLMDGQIKPWLCITALDLRNRSPAAIAKYFDNKILLHLFSEKCNNKFNIASVQIEPRSIPVDYYGCTTLYTAASTNDLDAARTALAEGADCMQINPQSGRNALHLGFYYGDAAMAALLIQQPKIDPFIGDTDAHRTILHIVTYKGDLAVLTMLIGTMGDNAHEQLNRIVDADKRTALHTAAMSTDTPAQREQVIDLLFANGIRHEQKDALGYTALMIAELRGNKVVAARIKSCIEQIQQKPPVTFMYTPSTHTTDSSIIPQSSAPLHYMSLLNTG